MAADVEEAETTRAHDKTSKHSDLDTKTGSFSSFPTARRICLTALHSQIEMT